MVLGPFQISFPTPPSIVPRRRGLLCPNIQKQGAKETSPLFPKEFPPAKMPSNYCLCPCPLPTQVERDRYSTFS